MLFGKVTVSDLFFFLFFPFVINRLSWAKYKRNKTARRKHFHKFFPRLKNKKQKENKKKRDKLAIPLWKCKSLCSSAVTLSKKRRRSHGSGRLVGCLHFNPYAKPQFIWRPEMPDTEFCSCSVTCENCEKWVSPGLLLVWPERKIPIRTGGTSWLRKSEERTVLFQTIDTTVSSKVDLR